MSQFKSSSHAPAFPPEGSRDSLEELFHAAHPSPPMYEELEQRLEEAIIEIRARYGYEKKDEALGRIDPQYEGFIAQSALAHVDARVVAEGELASKHKKAVIFSDLQEVSLENVEVLHFMGRGSSHINRGEPNQDRAVQYYEQFEEGSEARIFSVCDGVSAGRQNELGSELISLLTVKAARDILVDYHDSIKNPLFAARLYTEVAVALEELYQSLDIDRDTFALDVIGATSQLAILTNKEYAVFGLGDGYSVIGDAVISNEAISGKEKLFEQLRIDYGGMKVPLLASMPSTFSGSFRFQYQQFRASTETGREYHSFSPPLSALKALAADPLKFLEEHPEHPLSKWVEIEWLRHAEEGESTIAKGDALETALFNAVGRFVQSQSLGYELLVYDSAEAVLSQNSQVYGVGSDGLRYLPPRSTQEDGLIEYSDGRIGVSFGALLGMKPEEAEDFLYCYNALTLEDDITVIQALRVTEDSVEEYLDALLDDYELEGVVRYFKDRLEEDPDAVVEDFREGEFGRLEIPDELEAQFEDFFNAFLVTSHRLTERETTLAAIAGARLREQYGFDFSTIERSRLLPFRDDISFAGFRVFSSEE